MSATTPNVVDVDDATFEQMVVEGSKERPVVVDLWADWCGPCKQLGPVLEKVADERDGGFLLAKVDVDANQVGNALLQAIGSQSIPSVVAFRDGQIVDAFIGAYPEQAVKEFVDALLPTEAELAAEEAHVEEASGDLAGAEQAYREALQKDPQNREAAVGLGRILVDRGDLQEGRKLLTPLLPDAAAERVLAAARVREWGTGADEGRMAAAKRCAAAGRWREAFDAMMAALPDDRDDARATMLDAFAVLGEDDPLVAEYRRKLASALF